VLAHDSTPAAKSGTQPWSGAAAVLVSPADFESWKETATVRADADLVTEIRRGLAALKRGKAKLYTLEELFAD